MSGTTDTFARVKIDALLQDAGWNLIAGSSNLFQCALPDGPQADCVLCDRQGRRLCTSSCAEFESWLRLCSFRNSMFR